MVDQLEEVNPPIRQRLTAVSTNRAGEAELVVFWAYPRQQQIREARVTNHDGDERFCIFTSWSFHLVFPSRVLSFSWKTYGFELFHHNYQYQYQYPHIPTA